MNEVQCNVCFSWSGVYIDIYFFKYPVRWQKLLGSATSGNTVLSYRNCVITLVGGWWGQGTACAFTRCMMKKKNTSIHTHTHLYTHTYTSIYIYIYIYTHIHIYIYIYIYIYIHTSIYTHIYIHTHIDWLLSFDCNHQLSFVILKRYLCMSLSPWLAADEDKVSHVLLHVVWWKKKYIHTHTYTNTHAYSSKYIYTHIHIYIHTHTHLYIYTHTHIYRLSSQFRLWPPIEFCNSQEVPLHEFI